MSEEQISVFVGVPCKDFNIDLIEKFIFNHKSFQKLGFRFIFKISSETKNIKHLSELEYCSFIFSKDNGLYEGWNQIIDFIVNNGYISSYLILIGLDDLLIYESYQNIIEKLELKNSDFVYGNAMATLQKTRRELKSKAHPSLLSKQSKIRSFDIIHPGSMLCINKIIHHRFNTSYKLAADMEFFIRISNEFDLKYTYLPANLSIIGSSGISQNKNSKHIYLNEYRRIEKEYQIIIPNKIYFYLKYLTELLGLNTVYFRSLYWKLIQSS
jgi:hypothetical protein